MKTSLLNHLVDPIYLQGLQLQVLEANGDDVISGSLISVDGSEYPVSKGVPRFVLTKDQNQLQTMDAFSYKWKKRDTYDSPSARSVATRWLVGKYGFESLESWVNHFAFYETILDVGCGSGFSSSLWLDTPYWKGQSQWIGVDISTAVDTALERLGHIPNTYFVQADALHLPFRDNSIGMIFSEGVLHHTPSTRDALFSCARVLAKGGEIHFYVYRRKGPIREFTDDYVRQQIALLSDEEAWDVMRSLTRLGQILWETRADVSLKEDIPLLGIKAGQYAIQRFIYWNFAKLYWNPELSFEENVHINFDWYRPKYAHRQTAEQVRLWCEEAHLNIKWFHEQESGFTVRAVKQ